MKTCGFPVRMTVRAKSTQTRLRKLAEMLAADAVDPIRYKCRRCKLAWDGDPLDDYCDVVCSNCYGENILLVEVRLGFSNWGVQNGGKAQQIKRWQNARLQGAGQRAAAGNKSEGIAVMEER